MGDSILDKAHYLDEHDSLEEILKDAKPDAQISLLAIDGALTADTHRQLESIPEKPGCVFLSCGISEFDDSINELDGIDITSLEDITANKEKVDAYRRRTKTRRDAFRASFVSLIDKLAEQCNKIAVFGIYSNAPANTDVQRRSFGTVNDVIMEESALRNIPIINVGALLKNPEDFSTVMPVRPSVYGGRKIFARVKDVIDSNFEHGIY